MKFLILNAIALIVIVKGCTVFKGGYIPQPVGEDNTCVQKPEEISGYYKATIGQQDGHFCDTTEYSEPSDFLNSAKGEPIIATTETYSWPPKPVLEIGKSYDGDYGEEDEHGYGSLKGDAKDMECKFENESKEGSDSRECSKGEYGKESSNSDNSKKGFDANLSNSKGNDTTLCQYGLVGAQVLSQDSTNDFTGKGVGSIKKEQNFTVITPLTQNSFTYVTENNRFLLTGVCINETAYDFKENSIYQCREGPKSLYQETYGLIRDSPNGKCGVEAYDDPYDHSLKRVSEVNARCGFNKNSSAFCEYQLGDDYVIKAYKKLRSKFSGSNKNCHPLSTQDKYGIPRCKYLLDNSDSDEIFMAAKIINDTYKQTYYLTANNDKCVANAITQKYWMGRFGANSAYSLHLWGVMTIWAIIGFLM